MRLLFLLSSLTALSVGQEQRLPENVVPVHYDIDIVINLEPGQFNYDGAFAIEADVGAPFDGQLVFHAKDLGVDLDGITVTDPDNGDAPYTVTGASFDATSYFVVVSYDAPGSNHRVRISGTYAGAMVDFEDGIYLDSFYDLAGDIKYIAATQFETDGARRAFPCFDEPDLKATFNLRIGRAVGLISAANMPQISSDVPIDGRPGYVWDEYATTPVQATYIVAFAVADGYAAMPSSVSTPNGVAHQTWDRQDAIDLGYADYIVNQVEPQLVQYYEDLWGQPYPLPKMDQIGYPSKGGAMENWGLITYATELVMYDETQTGVREKERAVRVNAHENAHLWFGDLVTCEWWDSIWLNEGFADFVQFLGTDAVAPEIEFWNSFYLEEMDSTMRSDGRTTSHPTVQNISQASEADFGYVTYDRGATINRMIASILTPNTFFRGLQDYLAAHAFDNAVFDDLFEAVTAAGYADGTLDSQYDIKSIIDTYQIQMNYPLLTVNYDPSTGVASLSQQRFLYDPENALPGDDYRWFVPLSHTFVGDANTDFTGPAAQNRVFMTPEQATLDYQIEASDLPVMFNLQNFGYMRVDYDAANWDKIIDQLNSDFRSIVINSRIQLISDSFALAEAGIQPYSLPLDLAQYLLQEDAWQPLYEGYNVLRHLKDSTPNDFEAQALEDFLEGLFDGFYSVVGIEDNPSNTHLQSRFQTTVVSAANYLELPQLDNDAGAVFAQWMAAADPDDPAQNPVNRHLRPYVYCAAVREMGDAAFDFLQARLPNTALPQEKNAIEDGLSCLQTRSVDDLAATLMDPILQHPYTPTHVAPRKIAEAMAERDVAAAFRWLDANYEQLKRKETLVDDMLILFFEKFYNVGSSQDDIDLIRDFEAKHLLRSQVRPYVEHAINGMEYNMRRSEKFSDDIVEIIGNKLGRQYR